METENAKRNPRPADNSNLPIITLVVLILTILALLYVGYEYVSDDTKGSEELTNVPLDTTEQITPEQPIEPELVAPLEIDTSSQNAPVDQSQANLPVEEEQQKEETKKLALESEEKPLVNGSGVQTSRGDVKNDEPRAQEKSKEEKKEEKPKEPTKVSIPVGGSSHAHTVRPGETIYSIATRYNMSISTLKALNPDLKDNEVKANVTRLKVKVKAIHTVGPGDILRVVAEKYGVTKDAIMKANGKTKNYTERGEKLIIPYAEKQ